MKRSFFTFIVTLLGVVFGAACSDFGAAQEGVVEVTATAKSALVTVDKVTVTLTRPSDSKTIKADLDLVGGQWKGTIGHIPVGTGTTGWTFAASAYGSSDHTNAAYATASATSAQTISAGQTSAVSLTLQQVSAPGAFSNSAPIIDALFVSRTAVATGGTIQLVANVHDPDTSDTLGYTWTASAGQSSDFTTSSASGQSAGSALSQDVFTTTWTAASAGSTTITFAVTDQKGATAGVSVTVDVSDAAATGNAAITASFNNWPSVTSIGASQTSIPPAGGSSTLTVGASDPDGDTLSYAFADDCGSTFTPSAAAGPGSTRVWVIGGHATSTSCKVTVTITDGKGGTNTGTLTLTVGTVPTTGGPMIDSSFQDGANLAGGESVHLSVVAHDPDGDALGWAWSATDHAGNDATVTSTETQSGTHSDADFVIPGNGAWTVTATVSTSDGFSDSVAFEVGVRPTLAQVTFSPVGGTFSNAIVVSLSSTAAGATICYTDDGTAPVTDGNGGCLSNTYNAASPLSLDGGSTSFKAVATKRFANDSQEANSEYTFACATPAITDGGDGLHVADATVGATVYFAMGGATPDENSTVATSTPIAYPAIGTVIKLLAKKNGYADATYTYTYPGPSTAPVSFLPGAGTYDNATAVTLSTTTAGATICYTMDGAEPSSSAPGTCGGTSTAYSAGSPINVFASLTIKALATKSGLADSAVTSAAYALKCATPSGDATGNDVSLSDATVNATIFYTTDGTDPTFQSFAYAGPIHLSQTTTLKFMAAKNGYATSDVGTYVFTYTSAPPETVAPVTFSPSAGQYTDVVIITMATTTAGATICYTVDNSAPTASSGVCTGTSATYDAGAPPNRLAPSNTIFKAIGTKAGAINSDVTQAAYIVESSLPF